MNNNEIFTDIEEENNKENIKQEEKEELNPFVVGLPNWDLEPLYEPIKRGKQ